MEANYANLFSTSDWDVGIEEIFISLKMKSFRVFQIAHQVVIIQILTSSELLVEGFDSAIICLHYSYSDPDPSL